MAAAAGFSNKTTRVFQLSGSLFEVVPRKVPRFDDYWCAASEFAVLTLGTDWSEDIYVASSYTESVTNGHPSTVRFSLDPQADGITPVDGSISSGFRVGDHMSITRAYSRCGRLKFGRER